MAKISVYDRLENDFNHNGLVLADCLSCNVEEELNGKYILKLTYPVDEKGKWQYLIEESIIKAEGQLFRIYLTEKDLNYVYVSARHIYYDLVHNFLEDVRPTNLNGAAALNWILQGTQYPHNFIGTSDIADLNTQYYIRKNPVEAMLGADSLVTRWKGELLRDNYTIKLLSSIGENKGAQIAYGKNMLGLEVEKDMDSVITRVMPIGRNGLLLPEKYIDSPLINNYAIPRVKNISFDIGIDDNTTEAEAFQLLREAANKLFTENKIDIPYVNIKADLLMLENTEEYKHIKNLVKVKLGDTVSCTDNPINVTFEAKVIRVKKDILSDKNIEVELGRFKRGLTHIVQDAIRDISADLQASTSELEKAIADATDLLTNALGGYVVKRPGELLIMDTEDINTATQVWVWNLNGLGYSDNGINGPYRLAMTMDGKINADFITTGTMSASLVKAGVLSSFDNSMYINLDDNSFNFNDSLYWDGVNGTLRLVSPDIPDVTDFKDEFAPRTFGNGLMEISDTEGFVAYKDATKEEFTQLYPSGLFRVSDNGAVKRPYFFERHAELIGNTTTRRWTDAEWPTDAEMETYLEPYYNVILPADFIGKDFKVIAQIWMGDGTFIDRSVEKSVRGPVQYAFFFEIQDMDGVVWDGFSATPTSIKTTGKFRVYGWYWYNYNTGTYPNISQYRVGSNFKVLVDAIA